MEEKDEKASNSEGSGVDPLAIPEFKPIGGDEKKSRKFILAAIWATKLGKAGFLFAGLATAGAGGVVTLRSMGVLPSPGSSPAGVSTQKTAKDWKSQLNKHRPADDMEYDTSAGMVEPGQKGKGVGNAPDSALGLFSDKNKGAVSSEAEIREKEEEKKRKAEEEKRQKEEAEAQAQEEAEKKAQAAAQAAAQGEQPKPELVAGNMKDIMSNNMGSKVSGGNFSGRFSPKGFSGQLKNYSDFDRMKMKKSQEGKVGSVSKSRLRGVMGSRKAEALTGSAGEQLLMARDASKRAANYSGDSSMSGEYARFEDAQKVEGTPDGLGGDGMGQGAKDTGFGTGKPEDISNWGGGTTNDPCKTTTGPDIGAPAGPPSKECCKEKPETKGCGDIGTNFCKEHPGDPTCQKKDEKKDPDWIQDSKDAIRDIERAMGQMAMAAGMLFAAYLLIDKFPVGTAIALALIVAALVLIGMALYRLIKAIIGATQVIRQGQTILGTLILTTALALMATIVLFFVPAASLVAVGIMALISAALWGGMRAVANQQWRGHGETSEGKNATNVSFLEIF